MVKKNSVKANLESENNGFSNYTDVLDMIKGKFSGVEVKSSPSGGQGVYVRGQKSLTGVTGALYVVASDIASIDILKDGGAAIYGSRGANGVVVIETKALIK
ncbi:MAG: TonB-dependent receptor plug domain-containing protein [Bacteroidetes bacterium]|nr:TonB-dependent receptor plug domain-containing protein [Bacteroidota bacterium]